MRRAFGKSIIFPCPYCGAADSRDRAHQQGCPRFPPLSQDQLLRLARNCERLWAEDGIRRAEREQEEAREAHVTEIRRAQAQVRRANIELRKARRAGLR